MTENQAITELRKAALESDTTDTHLLKQLQQAVAKRGDEAVNELVPLLGDSDLRVSEAAADVLQMIASPSAYDELVAYALHHLDDPTGQTKQPGPGWARLRRLGPAVLPALSRAYANYPFDTRLVMIFIVQQIGDAAGLPLLEAALAEPDSELVEAAAEALGSVDGPVAYDYLIQLLRSNDTQHRVGAMRGLRLLGNPAAVEPLLALLSSEDERIKAWGSSQADAAKTIHTEAADAIDAITGEQFNGDVNRIREWLRQHAEKPGS